MMLCKRKGVERKRKGREEKKERGLWPPTVKEVRKPEVHQLDGLWKEGHGHSNCNVEEPTRIVNRGRLLMKIHMKCLRARELRAREKKGKLVDYPSAGPHKRERSGTPRVAK